jgi:putative nucleotidyltransferase with HDIG domain
MNQESAQKIALTTQDLPTMPHIASQAMQRLSDPEASARDLHEIISKDQAITARILRIANSACYARRRAILTVKDAVITIGFNTIKSIVISAALCDFFKTFGLAEKLMWEHSLGCGLTCRALAQKLKFPKTEEAFLAGLLHDVGKVVLYMKLPKKILLIVQEVYHNPGTTFIGLERELLGFDHAQVGELVARKWNFAEEIVEAIGKHHSPEKAQIFPQLCHMVSLGNAICHKLEIGFIKQPDLDVSQLRSARALGLGADDLEELIEGIQSAFQAEKDLFS